MREYFGNIVLPECKGWLYLTKRTKGGSVYETEESICKENADICIMSGNGIYFSKYAGNDSYGSRGCYR